VGHRLLSPVEDAPLVPVSADAPGASAGAIETVTAPAIATGSEGPPDLDFGAEAPPESDVAACAGQVSKAEFVPVDLFMMLDTSGSMLEMTPAGVDKWTVVKSALASFLGAPTSSGLGVGIQYFPLIMSDVPELCASGFAPMTRTICATSPACLV
jgi:hypothetical protein